MSETKPSASFIKLVYFDEESASDYLDIAAGGRAASTSEQVKERTQDVQARVEASLSAKLSWLPFLGGSVETGASGNLAAAGRSLLNKTLSNTIMTDYLTEVESDSDVAKLRGLQVFAQRDSMAWLKMFTPYTVAAKIEDENVDVARLDEALTAAKGYYELIGEDKDGAQVVLRFNIQAFRNNYGLTDLRRMDLVFHGIRVGTTSINELGIEGEMAVGKKDEQSVSAAALLGNPQPDDNKSKTLDVYDVILGGVERVL